MAEESFLIQPDVMRASREAVVGVAAGAAPLKLVKPQYLIKPFTLEHLPYTLDPKPLTPTPTGGAALHDKSLRPDQPLRGLAQLAAVTPQTLACLILDGHD